MRYAFAEHKMSLARGQPDVLLAVNPSVNLEVDPKGKTVTWWDPVYQRAFVVKRVVRDDPDRLVFVDSLDRKLTLTPLDLKTYRATVKPELPGGRDFRTEDEMLHFFTRTVWGLP